MSDDVMEFLNNARGAKYEGMKWEVVGDTAAGIIEGQPKVVTTREGDKVLLIDLAKPGGGGVTLWVREGPMARAIATAADKGLEEGGKLAVTFSGEKDTGQKSPLKLFEARYEAPTAKVDVDSIFGSDG